MLRVMMPASEVRAACEEALKRLPEFRRQTPQEQSRLLHMFREASQFSPAVKIGESRQMVVPE